MTRKAQAPKALDDEVVMNLVELALAQPSAEREAFLHKACGADKQLFQQVWNYVHWEDRMDGFLLEPLYPSEHYEHPFEPGALLDGRFRITREVAQGGMGVVYEAVDEKLDRRIAIKCAKAGFRKRLPPEVRNAREISHPNVCKIFEIHTASTDQGDFDFITMEFLAGETLAERLQKGPIPEPEARVIARQLAAGLAAAHRSGVIHGDLKSSNIILTKDANGTLRAVITDFGLARDPSATLRAAQSGVAGGTPNYMAPELWKGGKATTTSDVYAFGVMLYELASGGKHPHHSPKPDDSVSETKSLIAGKPAAEAWLERIQNKPPAINARWDRLLGRALDPDPTHRLRDGSAISKALEPSRTKRRILVAAAILALAAAPAVLTYRGLTAPKEIVQLAVLPFEAASPDLAPATRTVFQDLTARIAGLHGDSRKRFAMIPPDGPQFGSIAGSGQDPIVPGATHLLRGSLGKRGGKWLLDAVLIDTRSGGVVKRWNARYADGEIRYAGVALSGFVSGTLGLPQMEINSSVTPAARADYAAGLSYIRTNEHADDAVAAFERAVAIDPDSALVYAGLAEGQSLKYFLTNDMRWKERMEESVRQAENRNPDLAPVHRVSGLLQARAGYYELAEAHYRRAIELDPANGDAYRRLGAVFEDNNQLNESRLAFQKALAADPGYFRVQQDVGSFYLDQTLYRDALPYFVKAVELAPDEPNPRFALAVDYENLGRFEDAEQELRKALSLKETTNALHVLGIVLLYQRREAEATRYLERTVQAEPDRYLAWLDLGIAYRRTNRASDAAMANRRGLQAAEAEMTKNPRSGYVRSFLAYLCAATGDRRRAESEIAQALQLSPTNADARWMAVLTYESVGRRDASLAVLGASTAETIASINRWPDVADLRADSRFQQLLVTHQTK